MHDSEQSLDRGFSLIEVLIALLIVTFVMGAYITTIDTQARVFAHLQENLYAQQVAWNESMSYHFDEPPKDLLEQDYQVSMIDTEWHVDIAVEKTFLANFFQVRIEAGQKKNQPAAVFINYITRQ